MTYDHDTVDMFPELPRDEEREDESASEDPVVRALRRMARDTHRPELERMTLLAAAAAIETFQAPAGGEDE